MPMAMRIIYKGDLAYVGRKPLEDFSQPKYDVVREIERAKLLRVLQERVERRATER